MSLPTSDVGNFSLIEENNISAFEKSPNSMANLPALNKNKGVVN